MGVDGTSRCEEWERGQMGVLMGSELRRSLVDDMKVSVSSRKENGEGELHGQRQFLVDEGEAAT
jgi:hypothetical protein